MIGITNLCQDFTRMVAFLWPSCQNPWSIVRLVLYYTERLRMCLTQSKHCTVIWQTCFSAKEKRNAVTDLEPFDDHKVHEFSMVFVDKDNDCQKTDKDKSKDEEQAITKIVQGKRKFLPMTIIQENKTMICAADVALFTIISLGWVWFTMLALLTIDTMPA